MSLMVILKPFNVILWFFLVVFSLIGIIYYLFIVTELSDFHLIISVFQADP